jgi:hypothetical protein
MPPDAIDVELKKLTKAQLLEEVTRRDGQYYDSLDLYQEAIAELELAIEDTGWQQLGRDSQLEFSRAGLAKLIRLARYMFLKNPLIKRSTLLEVFYVWGRGVTVKARTPAVNDLIQAFLDDKGNKRVFSGHRARVLNTKGYRVEGNLFFALFTDPENGWVKIRPVPVSEIQDIWTNPEDATEPWFYRRQWSEYSYEGGERIAKNRQLLYRDHAYEPEDGQVPAEYGGVDVADDVAIYHMARGQLPGMRFGVPEDYSALDWARAVKDNLEAYANRMQALSSLAWKVVTKGGKPGVAAATRRIGTTVGRSGGPTVELNPSPTKGGTAVLGGGQDMTPFNLAGSTVSPEEGKRLGNMVAAGTGIPETMLFGDADVGNLATSTTLDRPTELQMESMQTEWADAYRDILGYVIDQAVLAPKGPLVGKEVPNTYSGRTEVVLDRQKGDTAPVTKPGGDSTAIANDLDDSDTPSRSIDITFPQLLERSTKDRIQAIVEAITLGNKDGLRAGLIDDKTAMRLLLDALDESDIDETLDRVFIGDATMLAQVVPPQADPAIMNPVTEALAEVREAARAVLASHA